MARIKAPQEPTSVPTNIRGALVFRLTKAGIVIAAWPKKRGRAKSGSQLYRQLEFGKAAYIAAHPHAIDLATAYDEVAGTTMVARDRLQQAAMGVAYDITDEDGNKWEGWRMVQANAQFMLDQVTDTIGAMLYRAPVGWIELPPGSVGQRLEMLAALTPGWSSRGDQPFSGATVTRTSNLTAQNWSSETAIPWQTTPLNSGNWPTLGGGGTRITVPLGINIAQANCTIDLAAMAAGSTAAVGIRLKNSAGTIKRGWFGINPNIGTIARPAIVTAPWPVDEDDYFQVDALVTGDISITMNAGSSSFSVQGW